MSSLTSKAVVHMSHAGASWHWCGLRVQGVPEPQTVQHGACLGLGLAALGTDDDDIFEDIKAVLFMDNAVAGEAAGIALGLVSAGSATDKATELLAYAHDTQHEKVRLPALPDCSLQRWWNSHASFQPAATGSVTEGVIEGVLGGRDR